MHTQMKKDERRKQEKVRTIDESCINGNVSRIENEKGIRFKLFNIVS